MAKAVLKEISKAFKYVNEQERIKRNDLSF